MKPDSQNADTVNSDANNHVNGTNGQESSDNYKDYDMDEEVMGFMHSNIHRQLMKFTKKTPWGMARKKQMMDTDTKAYFQEVIRGSGLFGILTKSGSEESLNNGRGGAESFMDNFDDDSWTNVDSEDKKSNEVMDNSKNTKEKSEEEPVVSNAGPSQFSRILLAQKVAEAFMKKSASKGEGMSDDSPTMRA